MRTNSDIPEGVGSAGLTVHRDTRTAIVNLSHGSYKFEKPLNLMIFLKNH
jgi:hypothetical protein